MLVGDGESLTHVVFATGRLSAAPEPGWVKNPGVLAEAARQLEEYFAGTRRLFDLRVAAAGTAFQRTVWHALQGIPYGETRTYGDVARTVGNRAAVRAVGLANGRNPLPIVIPCHRVIGSDGSLTGFGGGLEAKRFLLDLERQVAGWPTQRSLI
jgi:methylated-DNA-[protein]-cysteine S-methyltransferase